MKTLEKVMTLLFISLFLATPSVYSRCKSFDMNCDPSTGGRTYDMNRKFKQQQESLRTGRGSWDLNTDKGGSKRYDLNERNGCKAYDLNCKSR